MALFEFNAPVDFRALLADIDDSGADEFVSEEVLDLFGLGSVTTTYFTLDGGMTGQMSVQDYTGLGQGIQTSIVVLDTNQQLVAQFTLIGALDYDGGIGLEDAIKAVDYAGPAYLSSDPGAVIRAFGTHDQFEGVGKFFGGGGRDAITLVAPATGDGGARSIANGQNGWDSIYLATDLATARGGNGRDDLITGQGLVTLFGNAHDDRFIFDNGARNGDGTAGIDNAIGRIRDFGNGDDQLVFARTEADLAMGEIDELTLADLFGAGTLDTLGGFARDGLTYAFWTNGGGNAVIRRTGTDEDGNVFDERVLVIGQTLAEIDRADVTLMDYGEGAFVTL